MAFLVSPGVEVKEKDLTNIIPAVSTSIGGFAGLFEWGPVLEATTVASEADLINKFGYPRTSTVAGANNRLDWYAASNYLQYSNNLQVVRILPDGARNAASEFISTETGKISVVITGELLNDSDFVDYPLTYSGDSTTITFNIEQTYVQREFDSDNIWSDFGNSTTFSDLQSAYLGAVSDTNVLTFTEFADSEGRHTIADAGFDSDAFGNSTNNFLLLVNGVPATNVTLDFNGTNFVVTSADIADSDELKVFYGNQVNTASRITQITDYLNAQNQIDSEIARLRDVDSDAFVAANTNRIYTIQDVANGLVAAFNSRTPAIAASIDSDAVAGIDDPTVIYDGTGLSIPSSQTINGVTFTFFQSEELDTDASASTTASINNFDDFLTEYSTLSNGSVYARYPGKRGNGIGVALIDASMSDSDFQNTILFGTVKPSDLFDDVPGTSVWAQNAFGTLNDEVHVVIYTTNSQLTGTPNEVLETFSFLSKAKNGKTADNQSNYYVDRVNNESQFVYLLAESIAKNGMNSLTDSLSIGQVLQGTITSTFDTFRTNVGLAGLRQYSLSGGADGGSVKVADYTEGWDLLNDPEQIDVNLLFAGSAGYGGGLSETDGKTLQKYIIEIAEKRKDCIAFVSPSYAASVQGPTATKIVNYFNNATDGFNSTSYAVFDSGWKRQYDRYNDEYFWVALSSDIAGLTARTEGTNDAWWSPAGLNRGFIRNVVKLSFNPSQTDRDTLYPKRINPVVTLRGQGTLLFGDKTALSRPSAFDRINVRRLFIVLEKAIATASKYQLFEFNDDLTRRLFVNAVEPFLSDVKSRRGITDFKVVCDTSNNTGEVIDGNRFVADIYIKPARSINFITLNFVAVRTGVSFSEVTGA